MKIIHHFTVPRSDGVSRALVTSLGIRLKEQRLISTFDIDESDPRWPAIAAWSEHRGSPGTTWTVFTDAEIRAARWLQLAPSWHHDYPQPDELTFGYRKATYDLSDWYPACGIGMCQVAPFQMKKEPAWGKNSLLQLNWVFDEFFATPQLWQDVMRPRGVKMRRCAQYWAPVDTSWLRWCS